MSHIVANGFFFDATNNVILDTFVMSQDSGNYTTSGIGIYMPGHCEGCCINNGEVFAFHNSMALGSGGAGRTSNPSFNNFVNVFFNDSYVADTINFGYELQFVNCDWSNGTIPGGDNGLSITNGDILKFVNCDFVICGGHGCLVNGGSNVIFNGCSFISNCQIATANTRSGLALGAGVSDFVVRGCIAKNDTALGSANQQFGIVVTAGGSNRYIIDGNLVSTNATGGVQDGGTGINKFVGNNF